MLRHKFVQLSWVEVVVLGIAFGFSVAAAFNFGAWAVRR